MKINNMPEYAKDYKFIVAHFCDGAYWFFGAFNDENKADEVANMIHGYIIPQ
jgi:hypothetical protein